jgi:hypothetical protein
MGERIELVIHIHTEDFFTRREELPKADLVFHLLNDMECVSEVDVCLLFCFMSMGAHIKA